MHDDATEPTGGSGVWNLYSSLEYSSVTGGVSTIRTGVIAVIPAGCCGRIVLTDDLILEQYVIANSIVRSGSKDEICIKIMSEHATTISAGQRIAHLIVERVYDGPSKTVNMNKLVARVIDEVCSQ